MNIVSIPRHNHKIIQSSRQGRSMALTWPVWQWLSELTGAWRVDFTKPDRVEFTFHDIQHALMFKLTWGGQ